MVELLFPLTLREDMKDVFIHPRGLGLRGVYNGLRNVNIPASLMYLYYYGFPSLSSFFLFLFREDISKFSGSCNCFCFIIKLFYIWLST